MKFRKISTKMLTVLLSVILLSIAALSLLSYLSSKNIIEDQIRINMNAELKSQVNDILLKTQKVSALAQQTAKTVESTYQTTSLPQYEEMLGKNIYESDLATGSGIWFEPKVYDEKLKYVGPYVYKDGTTPVVTYDYSNAEYDYFSYDWYKNAKNGKEAVFSELYYDETLKATLASCSAPMYDANGTFIGVVTVDIDVTGIQKLINDVKIGDKGKAMLLTGDGMFITNQDPAKIMKAKITEDENASLVALGKEMLGKENGEGTFTEKNVAYNAYFSTVKGLGWKIMIQVPQSEVNAPLRSLLIKMLIVGALAIVLSILAITIQVGYLTKSIKNVYRFALQLSDGDFTTSELEIKTRDELGQMGTALNTMLSGNKGVISTIAKGADEVTKVSEKLDQTTEHLMTNFTKIEDSIREINEDMMSSSAATEEVNASVEEMNASVNYLAQETSKSYDMSIEIKGRAGDVEKKSVASYELANQLTAVNEKNLNQSMEDAKIVESIGVMAEVISTIAEQVNLLSLNASIEAARAGDQGKGFAVVAKEIGNLATQTTNTVDEIKQTTAKVQAAFDNLMEHSKQLLSFIKETVTPDYKMFVGVATQYGQDANDIQNTATKIADMTSNIEKIISEVGEAVQNIAGSSENTAANSGQILSNIEMVSGIVDEIAQMVENEKDISRSLDGMVKKFKL